MTDGIHTAEDMNDNPYWFYVKDGIVSDNHYTVLC